MRSKRTRAVRRNWGSHPGMNGVILEHDIRVPGSRLYAKMLVFDTKKNFAGNWLFACGDKVGRLANGACREMSSSDDKKLYVDPRYFCVIGLIKNGLTTDHICHEAVHAGFCFMRRKTRTPWSAHTKVNSEESIAYPAGMIASEINESLHRANLL